MLWDLIGRAIQWVPEEINLLIYVCASNWEIFHMTQLALYFLNKMRSYKNPSHHESLSNYSEWNTDFVEAELQGFLAVFLFFIKLLLSLSHMQMGDILNRKNWMNADAFLQGTGQGSLNGLISMIITWIIMMLYPQPPDLNTIEYLWEILGKNAVSSYQYCSWESLPWTIKAVLAVCGWTFLFDFSFNLSPIYMCVHLHKIPLFAASLKLSLPINSLCCIHKRRTSPSGQI